MKENNNLEKGVEGSVSYWLLSHYSSDGAEEIHVKSQVSLVNATGEIGIEHLPNKRQQLPAVSI
jgi:hypothetical protein